MMHQKVPAARPAPFLFAMKNHFSPFNRIFFRIFAVPDQHDVARETFTIQTENQYLHTMKKTFFTLALLLVCLGANAQKRITLEDIWQKGTFGVRGISTIRSLNDGENYCILTRNAIEKYSYKTGRR